MFASRCAVETTRRGRKNSSSHRSRTSEGVLRLSCRFVSRVLSSFGCGAGPRGVAAGCSKAELGRDAAMALTGSDGCSDGCQASVGRCYAHSVQRRAAARLFFGRATADASACKTLASKQRSRGGAALGHRASIDRFAAARGSVLAVPGCPVLAALCRRPHPLVADWGSISCCPNNEPHSAPSLDYFSAVAHS